MEQKETLRKVDAKAKSKRPVSNVLTVRDQRLQDIVERFVHGRRTPLVKEVLQAKTLGQLDQVVEMFPMKMTVII